MPLTDCNFIQENVIAIRDPDKAADIRDASMDYRHRLPLMRKGDHVWQRGHPRSVIRPDAGAGVGIPPRRQQIAGAACIEPAAAIVQILGQLFLQFPATTVQPKRRISDRVSTGCAQ